MLITELKPKKPSKPWQNEKKSYQSTAMAVKKFIFR